MKNSNNLAKHYSLLLLISLIWGSQFIFNNLALKSFAPLWIASIRALIGMVTLSLLLPLEKAKNINSRGTNIKKDKYYALVFFIGLFEATLPFFLIAWGQQHITSSMTAILIGTVPILTVISTAFFIKNEEVHLGTLLSVILGFIGLIILIAPGLLRAENMVSSIKGDLAVLSSAVFFTISLILIKYLVSSPPIRAARDILLSASIQTIIFSLFLREPVPQQYNVSSIISLLILGIFCAGAVYFFYVILVDEAGVTFASLSNYLVPLVGVILGILILHDKIRLNEILALVIIFIAMACYELFNKKKLIQEASE